MALLDALDLPEAVIVGHDFGGEALRDGRAVEVLRGVAMCRSICRSCGGSGD